MEILQWIVSTLAGMAVGIGYARMQYNRPRRKAEKALDEILADAGRKFVPPPAPPAPHKCRYVFKGLGTRQGWRGAPLGRHAGYECAHCKKLCVVRAHRPSTTRDFIKPEHRSKLK